MLKTKSLLLSFQIRATLGPGRFCLHVRSVSQKLGPGGKRNQGGRQMEASDTALLGPRSQQNHSIATRDDEWHKLDRLMEWGPPSINSATWPLKKQGRCCKVTTCTHHCVQVLHPVAAAVSEAVFFPTAF